MVGEPVSGEPSLRSPVRKPSQGADRDSDPTALPHGYVPQSRSIPPASDTVAHLQLATGELVAVSAEGLPELNQFTWRLHSTGYPIRHFRDADGTRRTEFLHRRVVAALPGQVIDHADGNRLNATRENLRVTNARRNAQNVTSSKRQKRGQFKGVHFIKKSGRWGAAICAGEKRPNGKAKQLHLGCFDTPAEAARAYDRAALKHFGEFAATNFPREQYEGRAA